MIQSELARRLNVRETVVRRMLEHLGAYGIDADALSHRAIAVKKCREALKILLTTPKKVTAVAI